jgi:hypothetical protein
MWCFIALQVVLAHITTTTTFTRNNNIQAQVMHATFRFGVNQWGMMMMSGATSTHPYGEAVGLLVVGMERNSRMIRGIRTFYDEFASST